MAKQFTVDTGGTLLTSLVAYWKMDETSGARSDFYSTNNLTDVNTVGYGTGIVGNAGHFVRASQEYLSIADASQTGLELTGDWSISCWINLDSAPSSNEYDILGKRQSLAISKGYGLAYLDNAGTKQFRVHTSDGVTETNALYNLTLNTATWYHVLVTFNSATPLGKLYINGIEKTLSSGSYSAVADNTNAFEVGIYTTDTSSTFDGYIDEIGIWTKILAAQEIADLYNSGSGNTLYELTAPTVTTTAITSITSSTASSGGNVTSDGGSAVTARGVCWSTSANPTTADSKTTDGTGTGVFVSSITGLSPSTHYHVRAYATNAIGTSYGADLEFDTTAPPVTVKQLTTLFAG